MHATRQTGPDVQQLLRLCTPIATWAFCWKAVTIGIDSHYQYSGL